MNVLCFFGLHQWYLDSAMFRCGDRCNRCQRWRDPAQGRMVEVEREAWSRAPTGASIQTQIRFVIEQIERHPS